MLWALIDVGMTYVDHALKYKANLNNPKISLQIILLTSTIVELGKEAVFIMVSSLRHKTVQQS